MEASEWGETIDLDPQRFVSLHFVRRWPAYVVEWSLKQRVGESDFPVSSGTREEIPSPEADAGEIWQRLRQSSIDEAQQVADSASTPSAQPNRGSWLSRLLGRRD